MIKHPSTSPGAPQQGMVSPVTKIDLKKSTANAIGLAKTGDASKHKKLRTLLTDENYLLTLNSAYEYLALPSESLQLHFILDALADQRFSESLKTLDVLAESPLYRQPGNRQVLLLKATGKIGAPTAGIKKLWKLQLEHQEGEFHLVVDVLVENGTPEAIAILENALLTGDYPHDYVIAWLRGAILKHRQDVPLLAACQRLLKSISWPDEFKTVLVEILYDYKPEYWYMPEHVPPKPPDISLLTRPAQQKLLEIADWALDQGYFNHARHSEIMKQLLAEQANE